MAVPREDELRILLSRVLKAVNASKYTLYAYFYIVWLVPAGASSILGIVLPAQLAAWVSPVFWAAATTLILYSERRVASRIAALSHAEGRWLALGWVVSFAFGLAAALLLEAAGLLSRYTAAATGFTTALALGTSFVAAHAARSEGRIYTHSLPTALILWLCLPLVATASTPLKAWFTASASLMVSYGLAAALYLYSAINMVAEERLREDDR